MVEVKEKRVKTGYIFVKIAIARNPLHSILRTTSCESSALACVQITLWKNPLYGLER